MELAELTRLCPGELEREVGMIVHDGESCPIHESLEGYRTELQNPSGIPVRYVTIEQLYEEKGS